MVLRHRIHELTCLFPADIIQKAHTHSISAVPNHIKHHILESYRYVCIELRYCVCSNLTIQLIVYTRITVHSWYSGNLLVFIITECTWNDVFLIIFCMEETWEHVSVHWQRGKYRLWANRFICWMSVSNAGSRVSRQLRHPLLCPDHSVITRPSNLNGFGCSYWWYEWNVFCFRLRQYSQPRMRCCHCLPPSSLHVLGTLGLFFIGIYNASRQWPPRKIYLSFTLSFGIICNRWLAIATVDYCISYFVFQGNTAFLTCNQTNFPIILHHCHGHW